MAVGVEIAGIQQAGVVDVAHGGEDVFAEVGVVLFPLGNGFAEAAADGAGAQGTAAGHDRNAFGFDVSAGDFLRDVDKRADEAEIALAGPGDGRQRAEAAGEEDVAEEGFAEIVGGVAEGDDVGVKAAGDLVDGAAAEAAAEVATVIGLLFEEAEGGVVGVAGPCDAETLDIFADGLRRGRGTCLVRR